LFSLPFPSILLLNRTYLGSCGRRFTMNFETRGRRKHKKEGKRR
jgi:hypothetical protein